MNTYTLTHQTTISVQVIIQDETGTLAFSILFVLRLLGLLGQISRAATKLKYEVSALIQDTFRAADFTWKVICIGISALAFGLGVAR